MRRMKDSGIAWIGEIPEEWKTVPLARIIKERVSGNWGSEPTPTTDNIICIRVADFDFSKFSIVDRTEYTSRGYKKTEHPSMLTYGDILFEKSGGGLTTPVGRSIFFDKKMEATHSNFIDKLRIHDNYSKRFIFYYIFICYLTTYSNIYIKQTTGIQNFDLTKFLAKERICLPQPSEQHRIAAYLDNKCAEIDRSMELVRQSMDKLKAYRISIITEAVTKGLDPDVPMKDSGVPWIGEIPEEWEIRRFDTVAHIKSNLVSPFDYPDLPQISPENIEKYSNNLSNVKNVHESGIISGNHLFYRGQILYSKIRPVLNKIIIAPFDGLCSADMYPIESKIFTKYLLYAMMSDNFIAQVKQITELRVKMPKINQAELSKVFLYIPLDSEQHRIAAYLDAKCVEIDAIIARKQELLDKLAAYKKSLIFECVTGKREVAA